MRNPTQFRFVERDPAYGASSSLPYMPLQLSANGHLADVLALVDTGATVNVLPYELGLQLGFVWERQTTVLRLGGNLARGEARAVAIQAIVADYTPVLLAFAWTQIERAPMILGQMNFFQEFNVCFFRSRNIFEVSPR